MTYTDTKDTGTADALESTGTDVQTNATEWDARMTGRDQMIALLRFWSVQTGFHVVWLDGETVGYRVIAMPGSDNLEYLTEIRPIEEIPSETALHIVLRESEVMAIELRDDDDPNDLRCLIDQGAWVFVKFGGSLWRINNFGVSTIEVAPNHHRMCGNWTPVTRWKWPAEIVEIGGCSFGLEYLFDGGPEQAEPRFEGITREHANWCFEMETFLRSSWAHRNAWQFKLT